MAGRAMPYDLVRQADGPRPGQRYGRPRYAGVTRQRVNPLIVTRVTAFELTPALVRRVDAPPGDGAAVRARLLQLEQVVIAQWSLRRVGWSRA
jgi:hypothetical protein